mmetsp:Transcript_6535/g.19312  ORF Transcript_6535/g.19312 Transcript_6535/m.19312 type:complete len:211 (-) Transcript_6535:19-651(-)
MAMTAPRRSALVGLLLLGARALVLPRSASSRATTLRAWQTYHDENGTPYYYDTESGETSWTPPGVADDYFAQPEQASGPLTPVPLKARSRADVARNRQQRYKEACEAAEANGEPAPDYVTFMTSLEAEAAEPEAAAPAPAAPLSAEEQRDLEDRERTRAAKARALSTMEAAASYGGLLSIPSSDAADDYMSALGGGGSVDPPQGTFEPDG